MAPSRLPTYFISHGGGPWPYMKAQTGGMYDRLEASLAAIPRELGATPTAVLMVSGHWEAPAFTVQTHPQPPMVYDYAGFPPHTYQVRYAAPGRPELASRVQTMLADAGLPTAADPRRGFDHGAFTPLVVMYPQADVPVVQLSLQHGYDPAAHLAVGRALAPLRDEGVLIVGSGLSYHNLRKLGPSGRDASRAFDAWLQETLSAEPAERTRRLLAWTEAPAAREVHPEEDHLIPLMVAVGAAEQEQAACVYHEDTFFGHLTASSFRFGAAT